MKTQKKTLPFLYVLFNLGLHPDETENKPSNPILKTDDEAGREKDKKIVNQSNK